MCAEGTASPKGSSAESACQPPPSPPNETPLGPRVSPVSTIVVVVPTVVILLVLACAAYFFARQREMWNRIDAGEGQYAWRSHSMFVPDVTNQEIGDRAGLAAASDYARELEKLERYKAMAEELGDREGVGNACNNLGLFFEKTGDLPAAARALMQGLAAHQRVERDLDEHDDRRVSMFERQQITYMVLQSVLLELGQPEWALGVAARAKGRALLYHLKVSGGNTHGDEVDASMKAVAPSKAKSNDRMFGSSSRMFQCPRKFNQEPKFLSALPKFGVGSECETPPGECGVRTIGVSYWDVCEAWWREVQQDAQVEGVAGAERIVEYSFLLRDRLAIWVLSHTGDLMFSTTVPTRYARVGETIAEALEIMEARRDAMMRQAEGQNAEDTVQEGASFMQGTVDEADTAQGRLDAIKRDQEVLETLYQHLLAPVEAHLPLAPVEAHLEGATEVLIIPNQELFNVPWAALFDSQTGQYLIQRCVLRVAPSLRVARTATDKLRVMTGPEEQGHALVVGNPLPNRGGPLRKAEAEAKFVSELLRSVGFEVHALMRQAAGKAAVQSKIEDATWGHFACHGGNSLLLAASSAGDRVQGRGVPSESPAGLTLA
jgi:hypothetical protein